MQMFRIISIVIKIYDSQPMNLDLRNLEINIEFLVDLNKNNSNPYILPKYLFQFVCASNTSKPLNQLYRNWTHI